MSLEKQIPYDKPSDDQWNEMAHVVFDELDTDTDTGSTTASAPARWLWPWVAALSATAAIVLGFAWLRPDSPRPTPAPQTTRLASTDAPTHATLGEVHVELAAASSGVAVGNDAQGWVLTLERGSAVFTVPPRRDRPPFLVQAGEVRVEVVGTRFWVAREDARVEVGVERGVVRVSSRQGTGVELRPGDEWTNALEPETHATGEPEPQSETPAPEITEPLPEAPGAALDDAALFQRASALEARAPGRAARIYVDISRRGGRWSGVALFARARLEVDRGNAATAAPLLRRYLRRHPDGLNARDAREMLNRLETHE